MLTYLKEEYEQRWDASCLADETNHRQDGLEEIETVPKWLGQGQLRFINLPDMSIRISQEHYASPFKLVRCHKAEFNLVSKFYLSGHLRVKTEGIAGEYMEVEGHNYLYCLPEANEVEIYQSDKSTNYVIIDLINPDYLKTFMQGRALEFPSELQQFATGNTRPFFHCFLGKSTAAMQVALHQIVNCPYRGLVRNMFIESRTIELLALQFEQWNLMESATSTKQSESMRMDDIDRLKYARDILEQRMEEPPSLLELSRLVGLNDRKLKEGFRRVFGNTVFGYLRSYRLEQAQQLLTSDTMSVAEVAYAVGFSNRSYFAIAFRRKFGINPGKYLAEQRRYRQFFS